MPSCQIREMEWITFGLAKAWDRADREYRRPLLSLDLTRRTADHVGSASIPPDVPRYRRFDIERGAFGLHPTPLPRPAESWNRAQDFAHHTDLLLRRFPLRPLAQR